MLLLSWGDVRLLLLVLAAPVWVGGQLVLAALVPALRAAGPVVPRCAEAARTRTTWLALGVLLVAEVWNQYWVRAVAPDGYRPTVAALHGAGTCQLAMLLGVQLPG